MLDTLEAVEDLVIEEDLLAGEQSVPDFRADAV